MNGIAVICDMGSIEVNFDLVKSLHLLQIAIVISKDSFEKNCWNSESFLNISGIFLEFPINLLNCLYDLLYQINLCLRAYNSQFNSLIKVIPIRSIRIIPKQTQSRNRRNNLGSLLFKDS